MTMTLKVYMSAAQQPADIASNTTYEVKSDIFDDNYQGQVGRHAS
jgi:hypothetical protein